MKRTLIALILALVTFAGLAGWAQSIRITAQNVEVTQSITVNATVTNLTVLTSQLITRRGPGGGKALLATVAFPEEGKTNALRMLLVTTNVADIKLLQNAFADTPPGGNILTNVADAKAVQEAIARGSLSVPQLP